jgi:hypothetical protein
MSSIPLGSTEGRLHRFSLSRHRMAEYFLVFGVFLHDLGGNFGWVRKE